MLYANLVLPTPAPTVARIKGPLLYGDYIWPLSVDFSSPLTLSGGVAAGLSRQRRESRSFSLPPGIAALDRFGISQLEFGVVPPTRDSLPGLSYSSITIKSTTPWDPPIPFLLIDEVGVRWVFSWIEGRLFSTASVWGP